MTLGISSGVGWSAPAGGTRRQRRATCGFGSAPSDQGGFTLLELLIGLTLVSLILAMLFGALRLGSQSWEAAESQVDRREGQRLARGFLQRALLQAQRVDWSLEDRRFVLFQGTPEQMEFVTPLSDYVGIGGLYLVRVFLREQEGSRALMLERWLLHPEILAGGDGIPEWQPLEPSRDAADDQDSALGVYGSAVLLEDVGAVNFGYYGPQLEDDAETWQGEWSERPAMPRLVRLQLEHHGEVWVDLVVPLVGG